MPVPWRTVATASVRGLRAVPAVKTGTVVGVGLSSKVRGATRAAVGTRTALPSRPPSPGAKGDVTAALVAGAGASAHPATKAAAGSCEPAIPAGAATGAAPSCVRGVTGRGRRASSIRAAFAGGDACVAGPGTSGRRVAPALVGSAGAGAGCGGKAGMCGRSGISASGIISLALLNCVMTASRMQGAVSSSTTEGRLVGSLLSIL